LALFLDAGMGTTLATGGVDSPVASPLEIGDCALWLDAGQGITQAGGYVSQWDDMSGNSRHASQATGAKQPAYVSSGLNGRPVLRFDGTNDCMSVSSLPITSSGITALYVIKQDVALIKHVFSTADRVFQLLTSSVPRLYSQIENVSSYVGIPATNTSWACVTQVYDGTLSGVTNILSLYQNGVKGASAHSNGTPSASLTITSGEIGAHSGTDTFNGDIAEIIVFSKALTGTQRRSVERYLSIKYNIPVACGTVSQWSDQSGNARHASQGTADYRPLLVQGGLNGRPVLRFDAVDDIMTLTWGAYVVGNTWFLVLKNREVTNPSLAQTVFSSDNGDGGRGLFLFFAEGTSSLSGERITYIRVNSQIYGYGQCSSDIPAGNYIFSAKMDSSYTFTAFQNGGGLSLTPLVSGGFSSLRYPSGIDVIGQPGYGPGLDIAAIIVYNRALSDAERQRVERWLATRYGITLA